MWSWTERTSIMKRTIIVCLYPEKGHCRSGRIILAVRYVANTTVIVALILSADENSWGCRQNELSGQVPNARRHKLVLKTRMLIASALLLLILRFSKQSQDSSVPLCIWKEANKPYTVCTSALWSFRSQSPPLFCWPHVPRPFCASRRTQWAVLAKNGATGS